jgi:hypothetical protein
VAKPARGSGGAVIPHALLETARDLAIGCAIVSGLVVVPVFAILVLAPVFEGDRGRPAGASSQPRPGRPWALAQELAELERAVPQREGRPA